jgi:hypothetical protein
MAPEGFARLGRNHGAQLGQGLLAGSDGVGQRDRHRVAAALAPRQHGHHRGHHVERAFEAEGGGGQAFAQHRDAILLGHHRLQGGDADPFSCSARKPVISLATSNR